MGISTYHIHNVLRTYSRQLSRSMSLLRKKGDLEPKHSDRISISTETRRRAVFEKVTSDIVNRIIRKGSRNDTKRQASRQLENEVENGLSRKGKDSELVFKVITKEKGEVTKAFSLKDSKLLKDQLKEITKGKVN